MTKSNRLYKIFMTTMIVIIAGLLLATGIIAIQKSMKLNAKIQMLPFADIEIWAENEESEILLFRNFDKSEEDKISVNKDYTSISGNTLALKDLFATTFETEFTITVKNFSSHGINVNLSSTATVESVENATGVPATITPSSQNLGRCSNYENPTTAAFKVVVEAVVPQKTNLLIEIGDPIAILKTGTEVSNILYEMFITSTTSSAGGSEEVVGQMLDATEALEVMPYIVEEPIAPDVTNLESVVLDYWSDTYLGMFGDFESGVILDSDNIGTVRAFRIDTTAYILSPTKIYANEDSSCLFDCGPTNYMSKAYIHPISSILFNNFDTSEVEDMSYMFASYRGTSLDLNCFDTSSVADMERMFTSCSKLTSLDLSSLDTSNVTNMRHMFNGCSKLTSLDLSSFDTSSVTSMDYMFEGCSKLISLDLSSFDTSSVTAMGFMFLRCSNLTSLDLSSFDTSNVTSMCGMFERCSSIETLDLSSFDTSSVTSMYDMFYGCSGLKTLDLSSFDTSNVTTMSSMFKGCSGLKTLDLSSFDTSNVMLMYGMFESCSSIETLDLSSFDTSSVAGMYDMFRGCSNLTSLDLSNFDTSKVTDMDSMFASCSNLTTIYVGDQWSTESVTSSSGMFLSCRSLVGGEGTKYSSSYMDATYAKIDGKDGLPGYFTAIA